MMPNCIDGNKNGLKRLYGKTIGEESRILPDECGILGEE